MKKPLYTTAAQQDLVGILRHISQDKPEAAVAWVEMIEEKCLLIASQPEMGERRPQLGREVRCNFVGRYVIFHRKHDDTVEILRVITGDRNVTKL
ncbi:Plasmid stabilization system protein [Planctomycetes bacterium CA13]|uniref:Plasmid stabilization system protein n=1 Tax=Novipirellula herctigrandis TaxID=2527986 RepID=A0A5C5Z4F7_9BACT|nr:Plasmid stabilization system protein [Planctomycetes bacterium CA13]